MTSSDNGELADFLQARRERLTPQQAGLTLYGDRRRVTGLRREELAMLAGVSSSYYTRLEQGGSRNASRQVLDALATALQLNDAERAHLVRLGTTPKSRAGTRKPPAEHADPALLELLSAVGDVPALIMGRRSDVLAWNPTGHALIAPHLAVAAPWSPASRPNMVSMVFLDTETRLLYCNWPAKSRAVVGNLRLVAGKYPDDPVLAQLVGSLAVASPEFAQLWADHKVQPCASARYELAHPLVGKMTLTQQTLRSVENPDQTLVTHTAAPGSPAQEALVLLAQLVGARQPAVDGEDAGPPASHRGRTFRALKACPSAENRRAGPPKRRRITMAATFNHTIIAAKNREESARFYCELMEAAPAQSWGPFTNIMLDGGVMLQFAEPPVDIQMQHYAFLLDDALFDRALQRLIDGSHDYWADPQLTRKGETNTEHGGRGVYFKDPAGHGLELITKPYF